MHALPFLLSLAAAAALAPAVLHALSDAGHTKRNYRDRPLPCPFGVLALAAALLALIPLALVARLASTDVFEPQQLPIALYALGVLALGLVDDTLAGERAARCGAAP
ncbi:MAG: hypothetical protein JWL67_1347, partial [Solirubrobacterales bacterium]|nr:hypothetical protein [Solirubrobacterales bacterium]